MNLISQIILAFFVMMVTGTLAFGIWGIVRRICVRLNPTLPYLLLRIVCLLYVLPICYVWMQLTLRDGFLQVDSIWQMNFAPAGNLRELVAVMVTGWVFLTGRQIRVCLFDIVRIRSQCSYNVPEEDEEILAEFARVKSKLHIRGKIRVYRNRYVQSPGTYGVLHCNIVLPARSYSREQLSVIFHHELMHYKSGDFFFRFLAKAAGVVCHLGPLSDVFEYQVNEWSEYCCDKRATDAIRDEMDAMRYFEMIVDLAPVRCDSQDVNHICSGLYENQFRLGRRIDFMNKYGKTKKATRGVTVMATLVFALASVTPVYAAGDKLADVHREIYGEMENAEVEVSDVKRLEEVYLPAEEDNTYEQLEYANPEAEIIMPALDDEELADIDWTVSPNVRKITTSFYVRAGQKISISCTATPANCVYWIGIMDEGNDVRYVQGTGSLAHEFEIEESGFYRVLVQNRSKVTITANGGYMFYTPVEEDTEAEE